MVLIISNEHVEAVMKALRNAGEVVWHIGTIRQRGEEEKQTFVE